VYKKGDKCMKIKYEAEILNCFYCMLFRDHQCPVDKLTTKFVKEPDEDNLYEQVLPCMQRPCPIEIK
jgi:hypothetical protein